MWKAAVLILFTGTASATPVAGETFWNALQPLCGKAFEGKVTRGTEESDKDFAAHRMVMHVSHCDDETILIPFHVGENRSRTWVLTRSADGVRLKHDHRHEDGSEEDVTQYGGDTETVHDGLSLDFHADDFTGEMIPFAASNIWTMAIEPGKSFVYGLRREAENRHFRVTFDLTKPVALPPPVWGKE